MSSPSYRLVPVGVSSPGAVTLGIETGSDGARKAAVWWPSRGDVDADEVEFASVTDALAAAEAARALHGFDEVVVVLAAPELWDPQWGTITPGPAAEPIGDISKTDLTSNEAHELAAAVEAERDA
jgi:hypothetical protein